MRKHTPVNGDPMRPSLVSGSRAIASIGAAVALLAALLICLSCAPRVSAATTAPETLWQVPGEGPGKGSGAGEIDGPLGIATDPGTGHVFVVDSRNARVDEFTAWGEFVKAFGWNVDAASPVAELQTCTDATGCQKGTSGPGAGQFRGPVAIAVDSDSNVYVSEDENHRIQKFDSEGDFLWMTGGGVITGGAAGSGSTSSGSPKITSLSTTSKTFEVGQTLTGPGIPAGTKITDLGVGTATLSKPAEASATGVPLTVAEGAGNVPTNERQSISLADAPSGGTFSLIFKAGGVRGTTSNGSNQVTATTSATGSFHVGDSITGSGIPQGEDVTITAINAANGSLTLSAPATASGNTFLTASETAASIPFNASAAEIQSKLESLAAIGTGNVAVSGSAGGPWMVEFIGLLADVNLEQISGAGAGLTPEGQVAVSTTVQGGSTAEFCAAAIAPDCRAGIAGNGPGEFSISKLTAREELAGYSAAAGYLAIGPGDTLYAGDVERIQKFSSQGLFQGEITSPPLAGKVVVALEVDAEGDLYASLKDPGVPFGVYSLAKLDSAGGILLSYALAPDARVGGLALGRTGELYAVLDPKAAGFGTVVTEPRIVEFDATGGKLLPTKEEEEGEEAFPPVSPFAQVAMTPNFALATGFNDLATSEACGLTADDIFASYNQFINSEPPATSLFRAYGPNPDPTICPPPEEPPSITGQFASAVGTDQASLQAQINSHFWLSTTYYVEYGLGKCSEGGCQDKQPIPPAPLNSDSGLPILTGEVHLPNLTPGSTYHYRFVATTRFEGGSEEEALVRGVGGKPGLDGDEGTFTTQEAVLPPRVNCPNQQFRTGAAEHLSDCRAYEMVSPIDKNGADIAAVDGVSIEVPARLDQSATSGDALTYSAYRAFANPVAAPFSSQFLSRRGTDGWSTESISPGRGEALAGIIETGDTEYQAFSGDLCQSWLQLPFLAEPQLDPTELRELPNLFRRDGCTGQSGGAYRALTSVQPPHIPGDKASFFSPQVQGTSADGRCTVFRAQDTLTSDAPLLPEPLSESILYEDCGGVLRLVAVLPDGTPSQSSSTAGVGNVPQGVAPFALRGVGTYRAVSTDGTSIYWTVGGSNPGTLYRRINADRPQSEMVSGKCVEPENACTYQVSQLAGSGAARFLTASADGSRAIFSLGERLYEYSATNPAEPEATLLAEGLEKETMSLLGASEDATRIYFASKKVLAPGAVAGKPNLYFLEVGVEARFIGILDRTDLNISGNNKEYESKAIAYQPGFRAARVSPDGLQAAFLSSAPLTDFDNTDQRNGEPDRELFLYDASADGGQGRLVCVSCAPSGARPLGQNITNSEARAPVWAAARIPTWASALQPGNPLTSDGSTVRLFFDSFVPLSPRDVNGRADVYEWQSAADTAACEVAGAEAYVPAMAGCLSLISSGEGDQDSEFIDADPSGRNVFFATGESLVPQDPGLIDIYNAREGGGFPVPQPQPRCEGEACQQGSPAPAVPGPASNIPRKGNPKPSKRCPKGKHRVKRKGGRGVCVANKHKHQKKHRGHHRGHRKHSKGKPSAAGAKKGGQR